MQEVVKSNDFKLFKNNLAVVIRLFNKVKDNISVDVKLKYNLDKYNQIIEGSNEYVLTQYETWYDQLSEIVIKNNNTIKQSNETKEQLNQLVEFIINSKVNDNMDELIKKEIENNNELKETLNLLVGKIADKRKIIFNKKDNERKHKFDVELKNINEMKQQLDIVSYPLLK